MSAATTPTWSWDVTKRIGFGQSAQVFPATDSQSDHANYYVAKVYSTAGTLGRIARDREAASLVHLYGSGHMGAKDAVEAGRFARLIDRDTHEGVLITTRVHGISVLQWEARFGSSLTCGTKRELREQLRQLCAILDDVGIVHNDLSCGNVLLQKRYRDGGAHASEEELYDPTRHTLTVNIIDFGESFILCKPGQQL